MRPTRFAAGLMVLLLPILSGIAEVVKTQAYPPADAGADAWTAAWLAAMEANLDAYVAAGWVQLASALLIVPVFLRLRSLAVAGSPRWANTGAVLGVGWALGFMGHLGNAFGSAPKFATHENRQVAVEIYETYLPFWAPVDALWLFGLLLAPLAMAIALKRAGIVPWWSLAAVAGATALTVAGIGGVGMVMAVGWSALLLIGFAPAAFKPLAASQQARHQRAHVAVPV